MDTLPPLYYYFFWLVEPLASIAGAAYAIFRPEVYAADMLPAGVETFTTRLGATVRGEMIVGGLGNCFLVLAMISLSLFPVFKAMPDLEQQEKCVRRLLIPLLIADFTHIINTLRPLPREVLLNPLGWTQLIHGNVNIVVLLIAMRVGWLAGIARPSAKELATLRRRSGRAKKAE